MVGWDLDIEANEPQLIYSARCEHPVHEKSIREFGTWIDRELSATREKLAVQIRRLGARGDRFQLNLPVKTDLRVRAEGTRRNPRYIYEDIE